MGRAPALHLPRKQGSAVRLGLHRRRRSGGQGGGAAHAWQVRGRPDRADGREGGEGRRARGPLHVRRDRLYRVRPEARPLRPPPPPLRVPEVHKLAGGGLRRRVRGSGHPRHAGRHGVGLPRVGEGLRPQRRRRRGLGGTRPRGELPRDGPGRRARAGQDDLPRRPAGGPRRRVRAVHDRPGEQGLRGAAERGGVHAAQDEAHRRDRGDHRLRGALPPARRAAAAARHTRRRAAPARGGEGARRGGNRGGRRRRGGGGWHPCQDVAT